MAGRKTSKHDFRQDVVNPVYHEAEERVYRWLLAQGKLVRDDRSERTWHDFTIGNAWPLDVKCDTRGFTSGCVAWEQGVAMHDGPIREGWGLHHGLAYVVYVLLPPWNEQRLAENTWPLLVCHAGRLRDFAMKYRETELARGFKSEGTDRTGFGYVLDIEALREEGVVLQEGEC